MAKLPTSFLLSDVVANEAVQLVLPAILAMTKSGQAKREHLYIVVMDPARPFAGGSSFEDAILYEYRLGATSEWEHPYDRVARSKAEVSWRTGQSSHLVQQRMPYLYQAGDTKYGGSVVRDGIVVGASGVQWYYDQMFSAWIAEACRHLCIKAMQEDVLPSDTHFLGEEA